MPGLADRAQFGKGLLLELGGQDLGDLVLTVTAGAAGLGVVGDLFHGLEAVLADGADDLGIGDAEALADQAAFLMGVGHGRLALPLTDGGFQSFLAHDGAVHLFLGQAAQGFGDLLVGELEGVFGLHALDHVGQHGAGSDGAGTAEGLEAGLFDDAFIVDLQIELEGVATGQAAHFADGVGIFHGAGVMRTEKMFMDGVSVVPHDVLPDPGNRIFLIR